MGWKDVGEKCAGFLGGGVSLGGPVSGGVGWEV